MTRKLSKWGTHEANEPQAPLPFLCCWLLFQFCPALAVVFITPFTEPHQASETKVWKQQNGGYEGVSLPFLPHFFPRLPRGIGSEGGLTRWAAEVPSQQQELKAHVVAPLSMGCEVFSSSGPLLCWHPQRPPAHFAHSLQALTELETVKGQPIPSPFLSLVSPHPWHLC